VPVLNNFTLGDYLEAHTARPVAVQIRRGGSSLRLTIPPRPGLKPDTDFGLTFSAGSHLTHPSPFRQLWEQVAMMLHTLTSLINPRSDIGLSNLSGPVGIVHILSNAAEAGMRAVLMFTILVNVNLAVLNLLPIPVLDGGQMLFATIARLRGAHELHLDGAERFHGPDFFHDPLRQLL
jgi:regulator of sigma E protease